MQIRSTFSIIFFSLSIFFLSAQSTEEPFVYGDLLPDAPDLATRGDYTVGVRTIDLINENQIDILNYKKGKDSLYDRPLKLEVWYPSQSNEDQKNLVVYDEVMGNANSPDRPIIPFTFLGRANRDAKPLQSDTLYPLIIVSHGYTGSRLLFTYLTENLASKGYVVVSIDHTESTFRDASGFMSTLLNRSLDVLFVLNEIDRLGADDNSFLKGIVNADLTALIGYSMGGYGVINVAGAGYSTGAADFFKSNTGGSTAFEQRLSGNPTYIASMDPRIKAVVAMAPWGMERGIWDNNGLAGLKVPSLFIAGSQDDISGYEKGIKAIYNGAINSDRYLLTYLNARHNIAPNPPPPASLQPGMHLDEYLRYADSVWDQRRINNVNQHFITAFLGIQLKGLTDYQTFMITDKNTEQKMTGFKDRTWVGITLDHNTP